MVTQPRTKSTKGKKTGRAPRRTKAPPVAVRPSVKAREETPRLTRVASAPPPGFPIVGSGASAGGLEALEAFLSEVEPNSGMAYVVVTHQAPGRTSLLPELLAKHSR